MYVQCFYRQSTPSVKKYHWMEKWLLLDAALCSVWFLYASPERAGRKNTPTNQTKPPQHKKHPSKYIQQQNHLNKQTNKQTN